MDNHLNIFQAYHGGNQDTPDQVNRLEDNLTRSFIITLKYLQEYDDVLFRSYLKNLIGVSASHRLSFDLQNMTDEKAHKRIQKSTNVWMLLVSRDPYKFEWSNDDNDLFEKLKPLLEHDDDEAEDDHNIECAYLLKELKNSFKTGVPCQWRTFEIPAKEASSLYSLLHSCRPDGWIYDDAITTNCPLSILIESKIGNNQFSCAQLYRHLSGEHGYNLGIKARGFQNIISVTWENVLSQLEKLGIRPETITGQIYKQFKEYLIMSGEVLDLRKLNDHYDEDFAKNQFDLFLNKLDEAIAHSKIPLIRKSRRKFHPWDIYGIEGEKGKPLENPNFTISFSFPGGIGCSLTANNSQGFLKNVKVREFLEKIATNPDCEPRQRYRYLLQTNRLIDWKNGQQQGDKYQAFRFFVNFAEKQWQTLESINYLIDTADICRKKGAREQLISWEVDWVDINKVKSRGETPLRSANIDLFDNPNKLIKEIVDFYKELYPILLEMHKKL